MKNYYKLLLLSTVFLLPACQEKEVLRTPGNDDPVEFGISMLGPGTKTQYVSPNRKEIHWSSNDKVQIKAFENGSDPQTGVYSVLDADTDVSSAGYESGTRLRWRSNQYSFYGFYPESIGGDNFSKENNTLTLSGLTVEPSQNQETIMQHLYMFAQEKDVAKRSPVQLNFYPIVTVFGITISNFKSDPITINQVQLSSEEQEMSGSYSVSFTDDATFSYDNVTWPDTISGGSHSIGISSPLVIAPRTRKTIFLTLIPQEYDAKKMTLKISCSDGRVYEKNLSSVLQCFRLQPAHKYFLALSLRSETVVSDLSLGGAQMILTILLNNCSNHGDIFNSALLKYCADKAGYPAPTNFDELTAAEKAAKKGDSPEAKAFIDLYINTWENIVLKIASFFQSADPWDKYANERFNPNSTVYTNEEDHFTQAELELIQDFLKTVISTGQLTDEFKISADIAASDFSWVPNLQTIDRLQANQNKPVSIEIDNLEDLIDTRLQYFYSVTIKDCDALVDISSIKFENITGDGTFTIEGCDNLETCDLGDMGSGGSGKKMYFKDNPKLTSINLTAATLMSISNCSALETLTMSNAGVLTRLELIDTYHFTRADLLNINSVTVLLQNCSTQIPAGTEAKIVLTTGTAIKDPSSTNSDNVHAYNNYGNNRLW